MYAAWGELLGAIKANMDLRRYELATLAAARRLRSSYCSLAHGQVLLRASSASRCSRSRPTATRPASTRSTSPSWISPSASSTTRPTIDRRRPAAAPRPRAHAIAEIMDVILAAAAALASGRRRSTALGVQPDASYAELAPELREVLVVGRPQDRACRRAARSSRFAAPIEASTKPNSPIWPRPTASCP